MISFADWALDKMPTTKDATYLNFQLPHWALWIDLPYPDFWASKELWMPRLQE